MINNIFDFATSELSQDAFICWCVNWFNDDSKPALKDMAISLLKELSGADSIEHLRIFRQFSQKIVIEKESIVLKIDILLIVNRSIAVIIEDKTYSGEHDDQIARYEFGLKHLAENSDKFKDFSSIEQVRTVYFKTGFLYDDDKLVKADLVITGEQFWEFLSSYEGNSEILDSYLSHLRWLLEWYKKYGCYDETDALSFWDWNIARYQIAQYSLMRDVFPETLWTDRGSWNYRVYHGSNRGGSPWTEMCICENVYLGTQDKYYVFWRIDTDKNGPYISLRFYEDFNKVDELKKARHRKMYANMRKTVRKIVEYHRDSFYFIWGKQVDPGYCGNYKESSLIHLTLTEKLKNWAAEKDVVIQSVQKLTQFFCEEIKLIDM